MTNTFFEENTYYPIEKLIEGLKQSGFTHFTVLNDAIYPVKIPVKSGDPVEPAPSALPLVCDFISQGKLRVGDDVLVSDKTNTFTVASINYESTDSMAIVVFDKNNEKYALSYNLQGWCFVQDKFKKDAEHIIKITRDGNVVAEGNRYKDTP